MFPLWMRSGMNGGSPVPHVHGSALVVAVYPGSSAVRVDFVACKSVG
jgi:hypothetical protein